MDVFGSEDHTYQATKEERQIWSNQGTQEEHRWLHSRKTSMFTMESSEQQSKNDREYLPLVPQYLLTSKNPFGASSTNRSSSRVLAFDYKRMLNLKQLGEILREMMCGILGGIKSNGMIGQRGTKTNGANLSRSSIFRSHSDLYPSIAWTHCTTRTS